MKSIDEFPPDDLPLREKLPAMRLGTREGLLTWAVAQPGALPWLLKRGALYWEQQMNAEGTTDSRLCDATAALDLLKWRIEAPDDKRAVEHLHEVGEGRREKGEGRGESADGSLPRNSPLTPRTS